MQFVDIMADMMAKDPAARIQTADEVVERLKPWVSGAAEASAGKKSAAASKVGKRGFSGGAAGSKMDDTQSNFPEMPGLPPGQKESASQVSQVTHPVGSAGEETESSLAHSNPAQPLAVWRPLLVLVLLPLGLVGAIMLIAWLLKTAM